MNIFSSAAMISSNNRNQTFMRLLDLSGYALVVAVLAIVGLNAHEAAADIVTQSLEFEFEGLDLDTNSIDPGDPFDGDFLPTTDFSIIYSVNTTIHARLFQERSLVREIAFLDETPFAMVNFASIADATFAGSLIDIPFESDDTILLRTDLGDVYKIGNSSESATHVTFNSELLTAVPEPSSMALLSMASLTAIGMRRRRR